MYIFVVVNSSPSTLRFKQVIDLGWRSIFVKVEFINICFEYVYIIDRLQFTTWSYSRYRNRVMVGLYYIGKEQDASIVVLSLFQSKLKYIIYSLI